MRCLSLRWSFPGLVLAVTGTVVAEPAEEGSEVYSVEIDTDDEIGMLRGVRLIAGAYLDEISTSEDSAVGSGDDSLEPSFGPGARVRIERHRPRARPA